ncbi:MAG: IS200/IS605 family transposase [Bacteroidetes bacterium]|nr:IS200/IS605 family transposase [Bacteroidota bacterium]
MSNTYTQIHIHVVFAVQNRQSLIQSEWKDRFYSYISGIIQNHGHKVLQINGMPDHIHILIGMRPDQSLSSLLQQAKRDSSKWLNKENLIRGKFSWQSGYGAFSIAKSDIPIVVQYILKQEEHHCKKTFIEEYIEILDDFEVEYDQRFIFKEI